MDVIRFRAFRSGVRIVLQYRMDWLFTDDLWEDGHLEVSLEIRAGEACDSILAAPGTAARCSTDRRCMRIVQRGVGEADTWNATWTGGPELVRTAR